MSRIRSSALLVSVVLAAPVIYCAGAAAATDATVITHNRAGYVAAGGAAVHEVGARWAQPSASCGSSRTFASVQIGLTNQGQGLQVGTSADCQAGHPVYYAWHSFNGHRYVIHLPVAPGDRLRASITSRHRERGFFLSNLTQGWGMGSASVGDTYPPTYRASFLVTARSNGDRALPLTDFGRATFLEGRVNGQALDLLGVDYVAMETASGVSKAYPLPLQPPGRFAVVWQHH